MKKYTKNEILIYGYLLLNTDTKGFLKEKNVDIATNCGVGIRTVQRSLTKFLENSKISVKWENNQRIIIPLWRSFDEIADTDGQKLSGDYINTLTRRIPTKEKRNTKKKESSSNFDTENKRECFALIKNYAKGNLEIENLLFEWMKLRNESKRKPRPTQIKANLNKLGTLAYKSGLDIPTFLERTIQYGLVTFHELNKEPVQRPQKSGDGDYFYKRLQEEIEKTQNAESPQED